MNHNFMKIALETAVKSGNDIPIGAVIVKDNEIIAIAHNEKEHLQDVTAHAEILAIRKASQSLNSWRLNDCSLYVTLEPCPMCLWAILQARIKNLYFGTFDTLYGGTSTLPQMLSISNSKLKIKGGIMEEECNKILENYFQSMRKK